MLFNNYSHSELALTDTEILKLYQQGIGNTVSYDYDELEPLTIQSITHGDL
jgi:hypothetical protein